ncbi:MAG: metalloregulator ArsR/SmtB family transcription factor [Nitrososphaerales archaeon]
MKNSNKFKAKIFRALSDPTRIEILEYLRDGEKCVCEIVPYLKIAQPLVSRHLAILKRNGLVMERKQGNKRLYSLSNPSVIKLIYAIDDEFMDLILKNIIEQMA